MRERDFRLVDLLGPFAVETLPFVVDRRGRLVLLLMRECSRRELRDAVALQQALGRGVLVIC